MHEIALLSSGTAPACGSANLRQRHSADRVASDGSTQSRGRNLYDFTFAGARVRQNGANQDRLTGDLVFAVYHHDTSRELDPQLHTHAMRRALEKR